MLMDLFFYLLVFIVSMVIGFICLSREPKYHYDNRHNIETDKQIDRENFHAGRIDLDVIARSIRDANDPIIKEIMEQTCHIREKRRRNADLPLNREKDEV